jgi:hypothetical protein
LHIGHFHEAAMKSFTDSSGRTWALRIDVSAIQRVRELAGTDLCELLEGVPPLCERLDRDLVLLASVLWALVQPQAAEFQCDRAAFLGALDGPALGAAAKAFWEELENFMFPSLPVVGRLIAAALEAEGKLRAGQGQDQAPTQLASPGPPPVGLAPGPSSNVGDSGGGSGSSPAGSGSTPAPAR